MKRSTRHVWAAVALGIIPSGIVCADSPAQTQSPTSLPTEMRFRILDGQQNVGSLVIQIFGDDTARVVVTNSHLSIKRLLLKMTLDRHIEEHWQEGRFIGLSADLKTSGTFGSLHKTLDISRSPDGTLLARSNAENHSLPGLAVPMTLWGPPVLRDGAFFDATNGGLISAKFAAAEGAAAVLSYQGRACEARRVQTEGQENVQFTIWLAPDGSLCGLYQKSALADLSYVREAGVSAP